MSAVRLAALLLLPLPMSAKPVNLSPSPSAFVIGGENAKGGALESSGRLLRLKTLAPSQWAWDLQATAKSPAKVSEGERILIRFKARAAESGLASGEALFGVVFEEAKDPWTKSLESWQRAGKSWEKFELAFDTKGSYEAGGAQCALRMGITPQVLEIKDFEILSLGDSKLLPALKNRPHSYPGREAGAAWRKQALKDIQKLRVAPIKIKVVDASGKPVRGAKVRARQSKSAFRWGTSVSARMLFRQGQGEDLKRYEESIPKYFNMTTEENSLKWVGISGDLGPDFSLELGLKHAAWAAERGLDFRGHCLLWPGWRNSPKLAEALKDKPEELRKAVLAHVRRAAAALKGKVVDWDVVNEPWDNRDIMDALGGDAIIAECFRAAREEDPGARLFMNDYAILEGGGGETMHRLRYEKVLRDLVAAGAPLDGIGIQGHFSAPLTAPLDMKQQLDRFAAFGKPILITEYDIEGDDLELSADFLRDLLILCYGHPAVEGFIMWGFWDGKHWKKNAPLFKKDWAPKPALKVYEDLVMKQWRTDAMASTDARGEALIPGHLGDYEISVSKGPSSVQGTATLVKGGSQAELRLP